jgi:hypothetical protein
MENARHRTQDLRRETGDVRLESLKSEVSSLKDAVQPQEDALVKEEVPEDQSQVGPRAREGSEEFGSRVAEHEEFGRAEANPNSQMNPEQELPEAETGSVREVETIRSDGRSNRVSRLDLTSPVERTAGSPVHGRREQEPIEHKIDEPSILSNIPAAGMDMLETVDLRLEIREPGIVTSDHAPVLPFASAGAEEPLPQIYEPVSLWTYKPIQALENLDQRSEDQVNNTQDIPSGQQNAGIADKMPTPETVIHSQQKETLTNEIAKALANQSRVGARGGYEEFGSRVAEYEEFGRAEANPGSQLNPEQGLPEAETGSVRKVETIQSDRKADLDLDMRTREGYEDSDSLDLKKRVEAKELTAPDAQAKAATMFAAGRKEPSRKIYQYKPDRLISASDPRAPLSGRQVRGIQRYEATPLRHMGDQSFSGERQVDYEPAVRENDYPRVGESSFEKSLSKGENGGVRPRCEELGSQRSPVTSQQSPVTDGRPDPGFQTPRTDGDPPVVYDNENKPEEARESGEEPNNPHITGEERRQEQNQYALQSLTDNSKSARGANIGHGMPMSQIETPREVERTARLLNIERPVSPLDRDVPSTPEIEERDLCFGYRVARKGQSRAEQIAVTFGSAESKSLAPPAYAGADPRSESSYSAKPRVAHLQTEASNPEIEVDNTPVVEHSVGLFGSEQAQIVSSVEELPERISVVLTGDLEPLANVTARDGSSSVLIQLEPEHLGRIKFKVLLKDGRISARLRVDRSETRRIIESQLPDIQRNLAQHKIEVIELSVSLENGSSRSDLWHSGLSHDNANTDEFTRYDPEEEEDADQALKNLDQRSDGVDRSASSLHSHVGSDALVDVFA